MGVPKYPEQISDETPPSEFWGHDCRFEDGNEGREKYPIGSEIICTKRHVIIPKSYQFLPDFHAEEGWVATVVGYYHRTDYMCGVTVKSSVFPEGNHLRLPDRVLENNWVPRT